MKKLLAIMLSMFMVLGLAVGCNSDEGSPSGPSGNDTPGTPDAPPVPVLEEVAEGELDGDLVVWSFTNEVEVMTVAFQDAQPNVNVTYVMTPDTDDQFKNNLLNAVFAGNVPDVVSLESAFVREFVENGTLMNLSDLRGLSNEIGAYDFMVDIGTSPDGAIRAFTYQVTPGGLFYRRGIASDVWGNDSPEFVQGKVASEDAFLAAARELKAHAANIYMVASVNEFFNPTYNLRAQPWITDNKLVIDPKVESLFELAKTFRDEDLEARAGQWSGEWFSSFNSDFFDTAGNEMRIFSYFLPTWGLPYVIMPAAENTVGDWGLVDGPFPYSWGGTWIGAMNDAPNAKNAVEFVKFAALSLDNLRNWATGVYTNDYLKAINPDIADISQGPGDVVNSKILVAELEEFFDTAATADFLGGQNSYTAFGAIAGNTQLKNLQASDGTIQDAFGNAVNAFINGERDRDEALEAFRSEIRNILPDLDWS
ncbi:MAG: extracellular solute-binding protein [Oscillospiraceae bacterium]|nr:extracellular solute-binding protein [Oscillospiraceae bacterium]